MAKKANMEQLHNLHKLIAEYYAEAINSGEDLSSGTLAAINTFLKNNDIKVDVVEQSDKQNLTLKLRDIVAESTKLKKGA
jgi:ABC-type Zn uptake system ZnuABC Zn-binding protein ZnuA